MTAYSYAVRVKANLPQISTVIAKFLLQMQNKKMFDLENEFKSSGAWLPQWSYSMADFKIHKRHYTFLDQISPFPRC